MTRCTKFHHLFDEVGDFCGMSPTAISQYKAYREQVSKLVKLGIDEDFVFENFPEGPGRVLSNIKDDETCTKALNYVASCLKRKEKVTEGDLRGTLKAWQEETGEKCTVGKKGGNLGHVSKNFTNVKSPTEQKPAFPVEKPPIAPPTPVAIPLKSDTAKPVQPSFAAQQAAREQPAPATAAPPTAPEWSIETCKSGKCPDGMNHVTRGSKEAGLDDKCNLSGGFVRDQKFCPYLERERRAAAHGSATGAGSLSSKVLPKISRYPKLSRDQIDPAAERFVDDCLSEKYHRIIERAMSERPRECPKPLDVICSALMRYEEYLNGGCE